MLKLKLTTESFNTLAPEFKALYKPHPEGGYKLDAEEDPRVSEFRETNIKLMKERNTDGQTAAPPTQAATPAPDMNMASQLASMQEEMNSMKAREKAAIEAANRATFETKIREAGSRLGVNQQAVTDLTWRAEQAGFRVEDGNVMAKGADGNLIMSPNNASLPLTLGEWMGTQRDTDAPHLFNQPQGAAQNGLSPVASGANFVDNTQAADPNWLGANFADVAEGKTSVVSDAPPL